MNTVSLERGRRSSLAAAIAQLAADAGPALIPPERLDAMHSAIVLLGAGEPEFALESHFDQPRPVVDLTLRIDRRGRDALLASTLPGELGFGRGLLATWAEPDGPLAGVPFVEFEFDLATHPEHPWIGPAVEPLIRHGPRAVQAARERHDQDDPAALPLAALERLGRSDAIEPATRERLRQAVHELPRWGVLGQLARLDGRPSSPREGVRVFVSMPRSRLDAYFATLGAARLARVINERVEHIARRATWVDIDFGIHRGQVEAAIGYYREFRGPRWANSELRSTLARIRADSLCTEHAEDALRAWIERVDGRTDRVLTFKYSFGPTGPCRAKVYLSALRSRAGPWAESSKAMALDLTT